MGDPWAKAEAGQGESLLSLPIFPFLPAGPPPSLLMGAASLTAPPTRLAPLPPPLSSLRPSRPPNLTESASDIQPDK